FLCEAALIAAGIAPGVFRKRFAFEAWPDFDAELFEKIYNDDSRERAVEVPIVGADISPKAIDIARANLKSAGVARYVELAVRPIAKWTAAEVPATPGFIVTNPPYGERISAPDMDALYTSIGRTLKHEFGGWQAWIIGYRDEHFRNIGLSASSKISLYNGALDCELRQYVIFDGDKKTFLARGGKLKDGPARKEVRTSGRSGHDADRRKPWPAAPRKTGRKPSEATPETAPSENPLALRRNPGALRSLVGRKPSLPPAEGPVMRQRGWKKKGDA
ncbi:MAG: RNA methyltransferase, partial [Muribaculaceae bacterium]|nr:RNA methyltransferase [Muribaculaceae bacterium]